MSIEIVHEDILKSNADVIVQQVNCIGVMGGGLALSIYKKYPINKKEYLKYINKNHKKIKKSEELLSRVLYVDTHDGTIIANIFGQDYIRKNRYDKTVYTHEDSLIKGLTEVRDKCEKLNLSLAIPYEIGCGMANGNWNRISKKIEKVFEDSDVLVKLYRKS